MRCSGCGWCRDSGKTQRCYRWSLTIEGAREEVRFVDHFGNDTRLVSIEGEPRAIGVDACGRGRDQGHGRRLRASTRLRAAVAVPARDAADGARRRHPGAWRPRSATGSRLDRLHRLMNTIDASAWPTRVGATHAGTIAEEALRQGSGVCQDHAHIFIAAARARSAFRRAMSAAI